MSPIIDPILEHMKALIGEGFTRDYDLTCGIDRYELLLSITADETGAILIRDRTLWCRKPLKIIDDMYPTRMFNLNGAAIFAVSHARMALGWDYATSDNVLMNIRGRMADASRERGFVRHTLTGMSRDPRMTRQKALDVLETAIQNIYDV